MGPKLSRRGLLKAAPAVSLLSGSALHEAAPAPEDLVEIKAGELAAVFDRKDGSLYSLQGASDPLHTNFLGNAENTRGVRLRDTLWTGHVLTTAWGPRWQRRSTATSADIRKVACDANSFAVRYEGGTDYDLSLVYRAAEGNALTLDLEVKNTSGRVLEIGEVALALRANDDYLEAYSSEGATQADRRARVREIQTKLYEQKVLGHHFAGGYGSYSLLARPRGTPPFVLLQALDAPIECTYKVEGFRPWHQDWIGTDLLGIHTWAVRQQRGWSENPYINGHTSLVMEPGQVKRWRFRFVLLARYEDLPRELYESGAPAIRVLPSMVVQENSDVLVEIRSKDPIDKLEQHAGGIQVKSMRREGDRTLLTLAFQHRGQKTLKLLYGGGRWTNLHFFCLEPYEQLIKARGRFAVENEFYENPDDRFHRNHLFLPFDTRKGQRMEDMDDVSEVGGGGDSGFGTPLFLSEKNAYFPSQPEIDALEAYVDDCLFRHIQNPQTYEIRNSLYWRDPHYPSMGGGWSTKEGAAGTTRAYNYAFAGNVYHALYRIGKEYGLTKRRTAAQYLDLAFRTYAKGYDTGPYRHYGLITGSNALRVLADLKEEGRQEQYETLLAKMKECNDEFVEDPYPYRSEIAIDHTGQEQVYFFTRHFGSEEKRKKTVDTIRALRAGMQPVWFRYGLDLFAHPDLRSEICCWHSSAMNAMVLMQEFEDGGDIDLLLRAYPGHTSVMTNVTPEGAGYGWFFAAPGIFDHEPPRTFENGPAMWAFLRGAKAYVFRDATFGLIGLDCGVEAAAGAVTATPRDGVRKRLRFVEEKIDLEASSGEFEKVVMRGEGAELELQMGDSTGLAKTAAVAIRGLAPGDYEVRSEGKAEHVKVADVMRVRVPMGTAKRITIGRK
jgi:hypothetical protein